MDLSYMLLLPTRPGNGGRGVHPQDPSPAGPEGEPVGADDDDEEPDTLRDPPMRADDDRVDSEREREQMPPAARDATGD
jgi:hypothetical protein